MNAARIIHQVTSLDEAFWLCGMSEKILMVRYDMI